MPSFPSDESEEIERPDDFPQEPESDATRCTTDPDDWED